MDAIDAFDLERGVKFETYCVPRIRGAMLDELRTMDWVPRLVRSKASKLNEATKLLEAKYGRAPSNHELSQYMNITIDELEKMKSDAAAVGLVSLNRNGMNPIATKTFEKSMSSKTNEAKRSNSTREQERSHETCYQRSQPKRATHYYSLLLRGAHDERNWCDIGSERKPC